MVIALQYSLIHLPPITLAAPLDLVALIFFFLWFKLSGRSFCGNKIILFNYKIITFAIQISVLLKCNWRIILLIKEMVYLCTLGEGEPSSRITHRSSTWSVVEVVNFRLQSRLCVNQDNVQIHRNSSNTFLSCHLCNGNLFGRSSLYVCIWFKSLKAYTKKGTQHCI